MQRQESVRQRAESVLEVDLAGLKTKIEAALLTAAAELAEKIKNGVVANTENTVLETVNKYFRGIVKSIAFDHSNAKAKLKVAEKDKLHKLTTINNIKEWLLRIIDAARTSDEAFNALKNALEEQFKNDAFLISLQLDRPRNRSLSVTEEQVTQEPNVTVASQPFTPRRPLEIPERPSEQPAANAQPQGRKKLARRMPIKTTFKGVNHVLGNLRRFVVDPRELDPESAAKYNREIEEAITLLQQQADTLRQQQSDSYYRIINALKVLQDRSRIAVDYQYSTNDLAEAIKLIKNYPDHTVTPGLEVTIEVLYQHLEMRINSLGNTIPGLKDLLAELKTTLRKTMTGTDEDYMFSNLETLDSLLEKIKAKLITLDYSEETSSDMMINLASEVIALSNLKTLAIIYPTKGAERNFSKELDDLQSGHMADEDEVIFSLLDRSNVNFQQRLKALEAAEPKIENRTESKDTTPTTPVTPPAQKQKTSGLVDWISSKISNAIASIRKPFTAISNWFQSFGSSKPTTPAPITAAPEAEAKDTSSPTQPTQRSQSSPDNGRSRKNIKEQLEQKAVRSTSVSPTRSPSPVSSGSRSPVAEDVASVPAVDDATLYKKIKQCILGENAEAYWLQGCYQEKPGEQVFSRATINHLREEMESLDLNAKLNDSQKITTLALLAKSYEPPKPSSPVITTKRSLFTIRRNNAGDTSPKEQSDLEILCQAIADLGDSGKASQAKIKLMNISAKIQSSIEESAAERTPSPRSPSARVGNTESA